MKTSSISQAKFPHRFRSGVLTLVLAGFFCFVASILRATDGNFGNVTAGGNLTVGLGTTSGNDSIALGNGALAQTWSTTTVGHYNISVSGNIGNLTAWNQKDPAFTVGTGNSTTPATGLVVLNSGVIYSGNGTIIDPSTNMIFGNGTYLEVAPKNGLFLAGNFTVSAVDNSYRGTVGIGSNVNIFGGGAEVALGQSVYAENSGAVAIGDAVEAESVGSVALGILTNAYLESDVSLGYGNAAGSVGIGAVALGYNNAALNAGATASGYSNTASGAYSVALGGLSVATGTGAVVLGANLSTGNNNLVVGGQWNDDSMAPGNFTTGTGGSTPLFVLGNGSGNTTPSNAFAVLHNGNTTISGNLAISGVITGNVTYARRQGDIIMGTYGNGNGD